MLKQMKLVSNINNSLWYTELINSKNPNNPNNLINSPKVDTENDENPTKTLSVCVCYLTDAVGLQDQTSGHQFLTLPHLKTVQQSHI